MQIPNVTTVEQGLQNLNQAFPDWKENYEIDDFDCSEMSALVYQYFKCCGFKDVQLYSGWNDVRNVGHSWVVVDGIYIEATRLEINNNLRYYRRFNSDGYGVPSNDLDFWNSKYIIQKQINICNGFTLTK